MTTEARDIDALVDSILGGTQERYVRELTDLLIADLIDGVFSGRTSQAAATLAGINRNKINTLLAKYRDRISTEVMEQVQATLQHGDAADVASLDAVYGSQEVGSSVMAARAAGYSKHAQEIAYQTARGLREVIERQNIALADGAARIWYEVTGDAITAINNGLVTRDRVIADAVARLTDAGITTIDYKSGISNNIDVAIKRHLVTQVSQAGGDMTMARLEQYGHNLVLVSAHYGARPEHDSWQGKAYSLKGRKTQGSVTYQDFYRATEYGSVTGIKGVNCRHSFGPYYPGISSLPDTSFKLESKHFGQTSEQYYKATQRQRELERRIRKTKREVATMERAGLGLESPSYVQTRLVLGKQQRMLAEHCQANKLVRQPKREKAYGVGNQPRALRVITRNKPRITKYNHASSQDEVNNLVHGVLAGVRFSSKPIYVGGKIGTPGATKLMPDPQTGKIRIISMKIGKQQYPGQKALIDSLLHEELEARLHMKPPILHKYWELTHAETDTELHKYIQRIIDRYVKMKGL
ncbi:MAG: phage minor capsid protein [Raoultibacter sp.]